jgi:hypothetical protein
MLHDSTHLEMPKLEGQKTDQWVSGNCGGRGEGKGAQEHILGIEMLYNLIGA